MKFLVLFIHLLFATEHNAEGNEEIFEQNANASILVKIEEDKFAKVKKTSKYLGVCYNETQERWQASRRSKNTKKLFYNGYFKDEKIAAHASDTLARKFMENGEQNHKLNFPDDNVEVYSEKKPTTSKYFGVFYNETNSKWSANRHSKNEKKTVHNGYYKDEETAAHASDTLARKLMTNGEQNHKLNFPEDDTKVKFETKKTSSRYIGVTYSSTHERWQVCRHSKNEKTTVHSGYYKDEETAAHASDTLARKLMVNGEQKHKLNFPEDETEVNPKIKTTSSKYIGVTYSQKQEKWQAGRWSKSEKKKFYNGHYENEKTAAHASDTLARKLMTNGEHQRLNFSEDDTKVYGKKVRKNKRKRHDAIDASQTEDSVEKFE